MKSQKRAPDNLPSGQPSSKKCHTEPNAGPVKNKWACAWRKCPDAAAYKYSFEAFNPRVATKVTSNLIGGYCTIIGNASIPRGKVTSWSVKILNSRKNNGDYIYIGVAPSGINQTEDRNYKKSGWYFDCGISSLRSGPPHDYEGKEYGPRKEKGQYVHTGDSVGVVMDTTKGELSFVVNGVNLGVAYEGIPLDKPLVPCVLLWNERDSVEFDTFEVKEKGSSSGAPEENDDSGCIIS